MTYKQIEASRELRLWIGQILMPVFGIMVLANPNVKKVASEKIESIKTKLCNFKKIESL